MRIQRLCVYAGSSLGARPIYREAAAALGRLLLDCGIGLVYGGGCVGLMGVIADEVLAGGGEVIGVIPDFLAKKEVLHEGVPDMRVVGSMHERKALMAELADGFVALPGGMGTLEELFETTTWAQLALHGKPCGLLDVDRYWRPLVELLDHCQESGFIKPVHRRLLLVSEDPAELLEEMLAWEPTVAPKWVDLEKT